MLKFKQFNISRNNDAHLHHLEDSIILGGKDGALQSIFALRALREMLKGNIDDNIKLTEKWDGAPAVIAGIDPRDGKFFVSKKNILSKNPKLYKSIEDINEIEIPDLRKKMTYAFEEFSKLNITGIIHGDIMFTEGDIKHEVINNEKYLTFQQNTIVYATPIDSKLSESISKARIGVVWHTSYKGDTFETMKPSYGVDINSLKVNENVWTTSANIEDLSGKITLTKKETKLLDQNIIKAGYLYKNIDKQFLEDLNGYFGVQKNIMESVNSFIRRDDDLPDSKDLAEATVTYSMNKFDKKIDSLKTARGKERHINEKEKMEIFFESNIESLKNLFEMYIHIFESKNLVINKLNQLNTMSTFVKTKNGFSLTGNEGFVIIDKISENAIKIVDRLEFNNNNFSADIIRGWDITKKV